MSDMNIDDLVRDTANAQRMANVANIVEDNVNNTYLPRGIKPRFCFAYILCLKNT